MAGESQQSEHAPAKVIQCGHCPEALPPLMQDLLDHAKSHALSVSKCFPLELSDETRAYIRQLR